MIVLYGTVVNNTNHNNNNYSSNSNKDNANKSTHKKDDYQCNKGCGQEIYFDANHSKNQSGKWIPLAKDTGLPHQCTEAELNYNKCYDLLLWLVYEVFIARQAMIWLFHIYL